LAISDSNAATHVEKKRNLDFSENQGTIDPSSPKKAQVSPVALTPEPLISEPEPMDTTCTGKAWAMEKVVDTTG
jgi:hypothetical protein